MRGQQNINSIILNRF